MFLPRLIAFLAAHVALVAINLCWEWCGGTWRRPKIQEASEVMSYYLGIFLAVILGACVVAVVAFPSAILADRLFQKKKLSRVFPYLLFIGVAVIITTTLAVSREGVIRPLDLPAAIIYFASGSCIVWKLSYESPRRKDL